MKAQGRPLRAIAEAVWAKGLKISHEGVKGVLWRGARHERGREGVD